MAGSDWDKNSKQEGSMASQKADMGTTSGTAASVGSSGSGIDATGGLAPGSDLGASGSDSQTGMGGTGMGGSASGSESTGRSGTVGAAGTGADSTGMDAARFRQHFDSNYAGQDRSYNDYDPAYRYGHELARNDEYRGQDWSKVEPHARREWDTRNAGKESTWERFKDAIRHGWDTVTGAD